MLVPLRDRSGLVQAACEIFEEAFREAETEKAIRAAALAADPEKLIESAAPKRGLSPGYYDAVHYLLGLQETLATGVKLELTAYDVEGLEAMRAAQIKFRKEHPACGGCGELNSRFAPACRGCGEKFKRGGK